MPEKHTCNVAFVGSFVVNVIVPLNAPLAVGVTVSVYGTELPAATVCAVFGLMETVAFVSVELGAPTLRVFVDGAFEIVND